MGGWIAYHVKHLINCPIVHISSMTNTNRIIPPLINHPIIYWAIKKGIVFNRFTEKIAVHLFCNNRSSPQIFLHVTGLLRKGNKNNINNQLRLVLNPVNETITVQPDLRIHSANDTILKPPAEPYYPVPGDHFSLYTHPEDVYPPLVAFLQKRAAGFGTAI
jgi:hypothetical protein